MVCKAQTIESDSNRTLLENSFEFRPILVVNSAKMLLAFLMTIVAHPVCPCEVDFQLRGPSGYNRI